MLNDRPANKSIEVVDVEKKKERKPKDAKKAKKYVLSSGRFGKLKFELMLNTRYRRNDGSYALCTRVYADRKYVYIPTGHSLTTKEFDAIPTDVEKTAADNYDMIVARCKEALLDGRFSIDSVKDIADKKSKSEITTLNQLFVEKIDYLESNGMGNTAVHYRWALKKIETYYGVMALNEVCAGSIRQIIRKLDIADTTMRIFLTDVKSIVNEAIYNGHLRQEQSPFRRNRYEKDKIVLPKSAKRSENYLTKDEMRLVHEHFKTIDKHGMKKCVGLFLLSYLTGGMNVGDLINLKFDQHYFNNDRMEFEYVRNKTAHSNGFPVRVPNTKYVKELMDAMGVVEKRGEYVFPSLQTRDFLKIKKLNSHITCNLKSVAKKCGIPKSISMTFARHSYRTVGMRELIPYDFLEYEMGHANNGVSSHYTGGYTSLQMIEFNERLL